LPVGRDPEFVDRFEGLGDAEVVALGEVASEVSQVVCLMPHLDALRHRRKIHAVGEIDDCGGDGGVSRVEAGPFYEGSD
jgi:hypothetical protein